MIIRWRLMNRNIGEREVYSSSMAKRLWARKIISTFKKREETMRHQTSRRGVPGRTYRLDLPTNRINDRKLCSGCGLKQTRELNEIPEERSRRLKE